MIIYGKSNVAGFARQGSSFWPLQPLLFRQVTVTSGAPLAPTEGTRRQRQMKSLIKRKRRRKC